LYDTFICLDYEFTSADIAALNSGILPPVPISERWPITENQGITTASNTGTRTGTLNPFFINTALGAGTWRNSSGGIAT
jgi:hypothetical protein